MIFAHAYRPAVLILSDSASVKSIVDEKDVPLVSPLRRSWEDIENIFFDRGAIHER